MQLFAAHGREMLHSLYIKHFNFHKLYQWQHLKFLKDEAPSVKSYFDSLVVNGVLLLVL